MTAVLNTNIKKKYSFKIEDANQALSLKKVGTPNYRYVMHRLMGFSADEYTDMEYDLSEHARIIDTESLVAAAFRKKQQLILKNGFVIDSRNEKNLNYIMSRLSEIEFVTSQAFKDLLKEITENMVNFNNCFVLKFRKEESSSGLMRELPSGKEFKPIAGLYVLAAPTIDTAAHPKTGQIVKYRHRVTERFSRQFKVDDIYHMSENKRVGLTIGTPPLEAVKDDILLLRSIEQDAESMIHKHTNPFIHVQVGNDNSPARLLGDGTSEIDLYSQIIDEMHEQGGVATPHRVAIELKGAESHALRLDPYLTYFKQRVLAGLCISEVDLGSGGGTVGGSADVASQSLKEEVRAYQTTIEDYVTNYIFNEILLESPMYVGSNWVDQKDRVTLKFIESDLDKRIKIESHYLQLFQSGLITKEAAIRKMDFEESDLNTMVELPAGSTTNSVRKSISNNIIEPKNQHNIADSLSVTRYKGMTNYYSRTLEDFINVLTDYFPLDIIQLNSALVSKMFDKIDDIYNNCGNDFVNEYVEDLMFALIEEQDS